MMNVNPEFKVRVHGLQVTSIVGLSADCVCEPGSLSGEFKSREYLVWGSK